MDNTGVVVQFLSWEGTLTAADGLAIGKVSADIGVNEMSTASAGTSLQWTDNGWTSGLSNTFGAENLGQDFGKKQNPLNLSDALIENVFSDVLANTIAEAGVRIRFEPEAGSPLNSSDGLCPTICTANEQGELHLSQSASKTNTVKVESNAIHQWVIKIDGDAIDSVGERLEIFGVSEVMSAYYATQTRSIGYASGDEYIVPAPSTMALNPTSPNAEFSTHVKGIKVEASTGSVTIITEPAQSLLIRYVTGAVADDVDFQIGRLELGFTNRDMDASGNATTQPIDSHALTQQGLALGENANAGTIFATDFSNHSYHVSSLTYTPNNPTTWTASTTPVYSEPVPAPFPSTPQPTGLHLGALDFHDDSIWVGRFNDSVIRGQPTDENNAAVLQITGTPQVKTEYVVQSSYVSPVTGAGNFQVYDIDATAYDGTYVWVSAWVTYGVGKSSFGIVRFTPLGNELTDAKHFAAVPKFVGHGFTTPPNPTESDRAFAQGLRVLPATNGTPSRLYGIYTNPNSSLGHMAYTGIYEFDISEDATVDSDSQSCDVAGDIAGCTFGLKTPSRMWHVPQATQHLEGFDFVPSHPSQIFYANAAGNDVHRIELNDLFADNDINGDGAVDSLDRTYLTNAAGAGVESLEYDFDSDGDFDTADVDAYFSLDLNRDGEISSADIDFIMSEILGGSTDMSFDFSGDGQNTHWDVILYVTAGLHAVIGDLNLDGIVDSTDLGVLLNNFFSLGQLYSGGNMFTGSGSSARVDSTDFGQLLNNFNVEAGSDFVGYYTIFS